MLICLDRNITPIDIGIIRSKVKVRMITFVTVYHRAFIHVVHMLIGIDDVCVH